MKSVRYLFWNLAFLVLPVVVMFLAFPESFMDANAFVFMMLIVSLPVAFGISTALIEAERFLLSTTGTLYYVLVSIFMCLFHEAIVQSPSFLWFMMGISFLICFIFYAYLKIDEIDEIDEREEEKAITKEHVSETSSPVSQETAPFFNESSFDARLIEIKRNIQHLSLHKSFFDVEEWHEIEKCMEDIHRVATHFGNIRSEKRFLVAGQLESLFGAIEEVIEALKCKIDETHIAQIDKVTSKYNEKMKKQ